LGVPHSSTLVAMTKDLDPDYATVGGLLLAPQQLEAVGDWLRPDDFARPLCGEVYEVITVMRTRAVPIDPVTVLGEFRRHGRLRDDGYPAGELIAMIETVPAPEMTPHYARLVLEAATFRRIERAGTRITQVGRAQRGGPDDAFDTLAATWRDLADTRDRWQASQMPTHSLDTTGPTRLVAGRDTRALDRTHVR
jgi:replicative DNA helicase